MTKHPKIKVDVAIGLFNGNQSRLAGFLGVSRSAISNWKKEGREYVPTIHAYILLAGFPDKISDKAA